MICFLHVFLQWWVLKGTAPLLLFSALQYIVGTFRGWCRTFCERRRCNEKQSYAEWSKNCTRRENNSLRNVWAPRTSQGTSPWRTLQQKSVYWCAVQSWKKDLSARTILGLVSYMRAWNCGGSHSWFSKLYQGSTDSWWGRCLLDRSEEESVNGRWCNLSRRVPQSCKTSWTGFQNLGLWSWPVCPRHLSG